MESDRGGFAPTGFSIHAGADVRKKVESWKSDLELLHADQLKDSPWGGTDTETLGKAGVPEFELIPVSTHYFDYHHSALDQLKAVVPKDLSEGAAAMAVFVYHAAQEGL